MKSAQKISADDITPGIRPEEINRIITLKKSLGHTDELGAFVTRYRQLGWTLQALTADDPAGLDLDFEQPLEVWNPRLADLALNGVQVNLAVCTGASSNLMVLEVRGREAARALSPFGHWQSRCVAQVGPSWEHHYYFSPPVWQPPPAFLLDAYKVQVFGEGGSVIVPPSLDPQVQEPVRWRQSPWEAPPTHLPPDLLAFLQEQIPGDPAFQPAGDPEMPAWEDIYGVIAPHPAILQALLAPAATSREYYQNLLQSALSAGISDQPTLVAILWHAPRGEARQHPHGLQQIKELVAHGLGPPTDEIWSRMSLLLTELSQTLAAIKPPAGDRGQPGHPPQPSRPRPPESVPSPQNDPWDRSLPRKTPAPPTTPGTRPAFGDGAGQHSHAGSPATEAIVVNRDRYESMIYELGKLGAWHEIQKRYHRENTDLRKKFESQRQQEIDRLRQLLTEKDKKGWWR